ncbi:MAG: hypothetical protein AAB527_00460 [Patescibacteria group bacterium]
MADYVTKKELRDLLSEQTEVILNAVDGKFGLLKAEIEENRRLIKDLTLTLDEFMKRVINQDEEIVLLRAKVDKIAGFIKEKFGVEISAQ